MSDSTNRTERFTVEGFFEGDWHLVMSSDEQETAIRGAGSVVISGAFEFVRIMLNSVVPGVGRELVRIDQNRTVRNGAFVEEITPRRQQPEEADQEANVSKSKSGKFLSGGRCCGGIGLIRRRPRNWQLGDPSYLIRPTILCSQRNRLFHPLDGRLLACVYCLSKIIRNRAMQFVKRWKKRTSQWTGFNWWISGCRHFHNEI